MITIVDYGVGNIASLVNMFDYVGAETQLSSNPDQIADARKVVLPGVGAFGHAMAVLDANELTGAICEAAHRGANLLGICLGMQLLARSSEEGNVKGLGLISADVKRIMPSQPAIKVPNMGWRDVRFRRHSWMMLQQGDTVERFYFAHSYHMVCDRTEDVVATVNYDGEKAIAVSHGNVHGVQFHPEKSHFFGMRLLSDFARLYCAPA